MTLSFKTQINGKPTFFVEKIWTAFNLGEGEYQIEFKERQEWLKKCIYSFNLDPVFLAEVGIKIHTIRADPKNRWRVGMPIHFVVNNRTPKRFQFAPILPMKKIQSFSIKWEELGAGVEPVGYVDGNCFAYGYGAKNWEFLAKNDGFNSVEDFFNWFNSDFSGKIFHWTDFSY